jgi:hypothetical protein
VKTMTKKEADFRYDRIMVHSCFSDEDAVRFIRDFKAIGINAGAFDIERLCLSHTALMNDPLVIERQAAENQARAEKFPEGERYGARYEEWLHLNDDLAECTLEKLTPQEKAELRKRSLKP